MEEKIARFVLMQREGEEMQKLLPYKTTIEINVKEYGISISKPDSFLRGSIRVVYMNYKEKEFIGVHDESIYEIVKPFAEQHGYKTIYKSWIGAK
jgi:hypothetical protein